MSWGGLGPSWGGLWRSWDGLVRSSAGLGPVLGSLGAVLGGLGAVWGENIVFSFVLQGFGTPWTGSNVVPRVVLVMVDGRLEVALSSLGIITT